jgi:glycosyltransferase involved in cell wall biosynthesis
VSPSARLAVPARIVSVYRHDLAGDGSPVAMDGLRFLRMAEALARRGHQVDLAMPGRREPVERAPRLREVPLADVRWADYDAVKTVFHNGFNTVLTAGGGDHPFIISKLGSVVSREPAAGVHFHGETHARLLATQAEIARRSRSVTILTRESTALWAREYGTPPVLLVPTGVDAEIPPAGADPYRARGIEGPVALFAGNIYRLRTQPEVNRLWQDRLNRLGHALRRRGVRLVAMGPGATDLLDPAAVLHVGALHADAVWDWQRHARVGLVLAQGPVQDNESSKIYYYLRTGLPVVCERPVPNAGLIAETGHGALTPYDDVEAMAEAAAALAARPPATDGLPARIVAHHSWDVRAALYDELLARARAERAGGSPA